MDNEQTTIALDDETLESVNGAGLMDSLGRIGRSAITDLEKGREIGDHFGTAGRGVGLAAGAMVGIVRGIKNEIG